MQVVTSSVHLMSQHPITDASRRGTGTQRKPDLFGAWDFGFGTWDLGFRKMPHPVKSASFDLAAHDAVVWLRELLSESVDVVVTDPAYESLEKHRAIGTTTRLKHSKASSNDWFKIFPNARFGELFQEVYRVLKRNTHLYLFCDPE